MKQKLLLATISLLLLVNRGKCQTVQNDELNNLFFTIQNFTIDQQRQLDLYTKLDSELNYCIIETDSVGKVCQFIVLGKQNPHDTMYAILKRISIEDLAQWSCNKCIKSTIVIPIVSISEKMDSYILSIVNSFYYKRITTMAETGKTIYLTPFIFKNPTEDAKEN